MHQIQLCALRALCCWDRPDAKPLTRCGMVLLVWSSTLTSICSISPASLMKQTSRDPKISMAREVLSPAVAVSSTGAARTAMSLPCRACRRKVTRLRPIHRPQAIDITPTRRLERRGTCTSSIQQSSMQDGLVSRALHCSVDGQGLPAASRQLTARTLAHRHKRADEDALRHLTWRAPGVRTVF